MKDSKRNRRNQEAKAQKRAEYYKPRTPAARLCGNCKQPISPMSGVCDCPFPGEA